MLWVTCVCYVILIATEYHLGLLKAKLAKYRSQLLEAPKSSGAKVWFTLSHNSLVIVTF